MIEVEIEGVVIRLTDVKPSRWSGRRVMNRKGYLGTICGETGDVLFSASTWLAADGRWYPGHITTNRKEGPGNETPEGCVLEQLQAAINRTTTRSRQNASYLISEVAHANKIRPLVGLERLTVEGLIADARTEAKG